MMQYQAIFYKAEGLNETDCGSTYHLNATSEADAVNEALALNPPQGAEFIKILREGLVVKREIGLPLDADEPVSTPI